MSTFHEYLRPEEKRAICDARITAIAAEAYGAHLAELAFDAMSEHPQAEQQRERHTSLDAALAAIIAERARWETLPDGDDGE